MSGRITWLISLSGLSPEERERRHAFVSQFAPEMEVDVVPVPGGPAFLDDRAHFAQAIAATAERMAELSREPMDVLVLAGAIDPGLAEVRACASVPVVGPGEASMRLAAIVGRPLSIVTVDEHAVAASEAMIEHAAVKPEISSIRSMETPVRTIVADLHAGRDALRREATRAVREDGAEAIYLGSMTLPTLGITRALQQELGVPVFDPVRIAMRTAVECIASIRPVVAA
jgi:allantoin racemase